MFEQVPAHLTRNARRMRLEPTDAERTLWHALRGKALGAKFRRQLQRGSYILDFACLSHCLVVEVDGDQHADCAADRERDAWLQANGYRVLRFSNRDVLQNLDGVLAVIGQTLAATPVETPT